MSFGSEFFAGNRARLRQLFTGTAPIVLAANGLMQQVADSAYPFCQDASFWYFTGCDDPDVVLVIDKDKEYLILPTRDVSRLAFEGSIDESALRQKTGIDTILHEQPGWKQLSARLKKVKHVATLPVPAGYIEQLGMYTNPARRRLVRNLKLHNPQLELLDISQHVTRLRVIKQPLELAAIQTAIDITAASLKETLRPNKLRKYSYEYEVEAELARGFRRRGAEGYAFAPIVAGGERACVLHNQRNDHSLVSGELLLCDVGARYDHYAADITRTIALGTPTRRQQAVYEAVLEIQTFARTLLVPGTLPKAYEQQVEHFAGEKMRELGLLRSIEHKTVRRFLPHAVSHFLGLNTHDVGPYDRPLEPGMVLTVEPGIYIAEESIGVRIEDDVLITASGNQVLTTSLPHRLTP